MILHIHTHTHTHIHSHRQKHTHSRMQEFIRIEKFVPWPARWWNGKQFEYQWPLARRVRSLARSLQDSEGEPETRDWISESYHYKIEKRPAKILAKSGKVGLRFAEFAHLVYLWYTKNSIDTQRTALIHKEQHRYTKDSIRFIYLAPHLPPSYQRSQKSISVRIYLLHIYYDMTCTVRLLSPQ